MLDLRQKLDRTSPWRRLWHITVGLLALVMLGLIVQAGRVACISYPCRRAGANLLKSSPGCPSLLLEMLPLVAPLGFYAVGLAAWFTGRPVPKVAFFLVGAGVVASGRLSLRGGQVEQRLFYILMAWLAALVYHFHLALPGAVMGRLRRIVLSGLYVLALVWSLLLMVLPSLDLRQSVWLARVGVCVCLTLLASSVLTVVLLFRCYRRTEQSVVRRRIRWLLFGILLFVLSFVVLTFLPDTLGLPGFAYEWTFLWLLFVPLFYVYPLLRPPLIRAESKVRRASASCLLALLLLGIYVVVFGVLMAITRSVTVGWPQIVIHLVTTFSLLLVLAPLREAVNRFTHWVWYRGEVQLTGLLEQLVASLSVALDRETLRYLLIERLSAAMHLSKSALLLNDQEGRLTLLGYQGFDLHEIAACQFPGDGAVGDLLQRVDRPLHHARVRLELAKADLHAGEVSWLSRRDVVFWLPLVSGGVLQGLLLIGAWQGDFGSPKEKERALATLAHQSGIAAHNVRLVEQVQAGRQEVAHAHQQLLMVRERERRRLAHDLHDGIVQQLIGVSYQLAEGLWKTGGAGDLTSGDVRWLSSMLESSRHGVLGVVQQLRGLISVLRPAGLDELGLVAAIEGYVASLKRQEALRMVEVQLDMDDEEGDLRDSVAICLFRVAQEALHNAMKHARARHICISLQLDANQVVLSVRDDGCGFTVPGRLSQLAKEGHFGLVGMSERVAWAGGELSIRSQPGEGTEVTTQLPLIGGM